MADVLKLKLLNYIKNTPEPTTANTSIDLDEQFKVINFYKLVLHTELIAEWGSEIFFYGSGSGSAGKKSEPIPESTLNRNEEKKYIHIL